MRALGICILGLLLGACEIPFAPDESLQAVLTGQVIPLPEHAGEVKPTTASGEVRLILVRGEFMVTCALRLEPRARRIGTELTLSVIKVRQEGTCPQEPVLVSYKVHLGTLLPGTYHLRVRHRDEDPVRGQAPDPNGEVLVLETQVMVR